MMMSQLLSKVLMVRLFNCLHHDWTHIHTDTQTHTCKGGSPGAGRLISGALDNNGVL